MFVHQAVHASLHQVWHKFPTYLGRKRKVGRCPREKVLENITGPVDNAPSSTRIRSQSLRQRPYGLAHTYIYVCMHVCPSLLQVITASWVATREALVMMVLGKGESSH